MLEPYTKEVQPLRFVLQTNQSSEALFKAAKEIIGTRKHQCHKIAIIKFGPQSY